MRGGEPQSFFLYGEPPRPAAAGFLHIEPLAARSRPSDWTIRLHRHVDLNHAFLITSGGGRLETTDGWSDFAAPCLIFVPADAAHGFAFRRESTGQVLTLASSFLDGRPACAELRATLFQRVRALPCAGAAVPLQEAFAGLGRELGWTAPGHDAAVEASILLALVLALRAEAATRPGPGRDEVLLARFREQVELRFREQAPLQAYARALGVSLSRLHQACRDATGSTPLGLIQTRLMLEAERALLYSDMAVTDVALSLGFQDPAYFSRFFARHAGVSPAAFRRRRPTPPPMATFNRQRAVSPARRARGSTA